MTRLLLGLSLLFLAPAAFADPAAVPLPRAHAHNDYEHPRPLLDALDHGFGSVEADVFLVEGELLVAHDAEDLTPERSLRGLYLAPLQARVRANGGKVYAAQERPLILLIDFKSDGNTGYPVLKQLLEEYREMLTVFHDDRTEPGAVSVIVSGSTPRERIAAESPRLMAIDGRPGDLDPPTSPHLIPLVSSDWRSQFRWTGREPEMPAEQWAKLQDFVAKAHAQGQLVRFWGLPLRDPVWPTLYDAGVDLINTDDLGKLQAFLLERLPKE